LSCIVNEVSLYGNDFVGIEAYVIHIWYIEFYR